MRRFRAWRRERRADRRSERYCHHDLPCGCGKPHDPEYTYHLDAQLATDPAEMVYQMRRNPGVGF